jgi:hypothetical protein
MSAISDKLEKVNENFSINIYDNGYMIEVGGRDSDGDWKTAKVIVNTKQELIDLVSEVLDMPRND